MPSNSLDMVALGSDGNRQICRDVVKCAAGAEQPRRSGRPVRSPCSPLSRHGVCGGRKQGARMLRITDVRETMPDGGAVWTLKLEGNIQGEWVNELRRAWRAVRLAAADASIRLVLVDVTLVDADGMALLTEMQRDGVDILPAGTSTTAIFDAGIDGVPTSPNPTRSKK